MTKFLRLPRIIADYGLSRSSLYELMETGEFPKPIKLGKRSVAWLAAEVDSWANSRVEASRGKAAKVSGAA